MKKAISIIVIMIFSMSAKAQTYGVPEIDSLIEAKDKLMVSIMLETNKREEANLIFLYSWTVYQLEKWIDGGYEKRCYYEGYNGEPNFISKCPEPYEYVTNEYRDTMVYIPKEITFDNFMETYTNRLIREAASHRN